MASGRRCGSVGSRRLALVAWALASLLAAPPAARAAWGPEGADLARPRILRFDPAAVQARLDREPYRTIVRDLAGRVRLADGVALDDHAIESGRFKARAAKSLAFLYAIDRRLDGDVAVPFGSPAERAAAGARVRDLLVHLFDRSRLAVDPPIGGWDRDISTSEELLQYATAYDTMLGAGYDFGSDDAVIRERLTNLAAELYRNYVDPDSAGGVVILHQNNHRSKSGAALVVAGLVLAEETPDPTLDPEGFREPSNWIAYGLDQVDLILRHGLVAADGAYAEGPFYYRFTLENLLPTMRAWDGVVGGATVEARGLALPSLWRHPSFRRALHWLVDTTLPDGSFAAFDDGNVFRSHYYGVFPQDHELADAFAWHWADAPQRFETDGNVDLAADALAHFDDQAVTPAPRPGSPSAFYVEGGNATFRSGWSREAVMAVVNGEGDQASQFGRDRDGLGLSPQSHEHAEPGSFLLHAFGERLAIDPGYFSFGQRLLVNQPQHHNTILVDGGGPRDFFFAQITWRSWGLDRRPDVDGLASLADPLDGDFLDAVRVVTRYGGDKTLPNAQRPRVERRFLFADDRYLVLADAVDDPGGVPRAPTWLLHGNGGGTSGGSYEGTATGGRWTIGGARLDGAFASDSGPLAFATTDEVHEVAGKQQRTHTALAATAPAAAVVRGLQLVVPSPSGAAPPLAVVLDEPGAAALSLLDGDGDRRVLAAHRAVAGTPWLLPSAAVGLRSAETDGALALLDAALDGSLRLAWAERATRLAYDGAVLAAETPGGLGWRAGRDRVELVADNADPWIRLDLLPFAPAAADGACALAEHDGVPWVRLGRERRVVLRAAPGNAAPAADPGPDRTALPGELVTLDGAASCDADGDDLTPRWELVAAPPGSAWTFAGADGWRPTLTIDRPGPYRARLVVTDAHGAASRPRDVVITGGPLCANLVDDDLDGSIDTDDPDCDAAPANRAPAATADAFTVSAGATLEPAAGVLGNDADPDGGPLVAVLAAAPAGDLWLRPDGSFRYTPPPGFRGTDRFLYRARDAAGAESAPAPVSIEVAGAPRDRVILLLAGGPAPALHWGELASGDVAVLRNEAGKAVAVIGGGVVEGTGASVHFDLTRRAPGDWTGTVSLSDPRIAGPPRVIPIDGRRRIFPYTSQRGVLGWSGFPNPGLPPGAALLFAVHDAD